MTSTDVIIYDTTKYSIQHYVHDKLIVTIILLQMFLEYSVQNNNYVILGEIKFEARLYTGNINL